MPKSPLVPLAGRRVLVMGLGQFGGGVGVTRWLIGEGAQVTVTDMASPEVLAHSRAQLADLEPTGQLTYKLGGHDISDFTSADLVVVNPAVDRAKSEHVQAAIKAGVPLTTEMNLFVSRCPAYTIGITGSVGKSTTTTMIHLALEAGLKNSGSKVYLGGNIGKSLLPELINIRPEDVVVLELSSFMLEDTPAALWSPNMAVITNLFGNHLDRHGSLEGLAAAKQTILRYQQQDDVAIFNADNSLVAQWVTLAHGRAVMYTACNTATHIPLKVPGLHNQSNAQAALAVLDNLPVQVDRTAALTALAEFPGLSHRLMLVHTFSTQAGDIRFFNDSKATTPEASMTALNAFAPGSAIFLVGGYDKHADMSAFASMLAQRAGGVIGVGQTGQAMLDLVHSFNKLPADRVVYAETLDRAMPLAVTWAKNMLPAIKSPAVVLSPACASWGQYQNYEKRGDHFIALARQSA